MPVKQLDHVNFVTKDMLGTIFFYCNIIGLQQGEKMPGTAKGVEYLYIPGQKRSVIHLDDSSSPKKQATFNRYADPSPDNNKNFCTGPFDHFCLSMDLNDYEMMIEKLQKHHCIFETYCHKDVPLKQIWVLDPNGIRVELHFSTN